MTEEDTFRALCRDPYPETVKKVLDFIHNRIGTGGSTEDFAHVVDTYCQLHGWTLDELQDAVRKESGHE